MLLFGHKSKWRFGVGDIVKANKSEVLCKGVNCPRSNFKLLNMLHSDCLLEVISYLEVQDTISLARTSVYFYESVYADKRIWFNYENVVRMWMQNKMMKRFMHDDKLLLLNQVESAIQFRVSKIKYNNYLSKFIHYIYLLPMVFLEEYGTYCSLHRVNPPMLFMIDNKLFEVDDEFLNEHPGGTGIIEDAIGTDATGSYYLAFHSKQAIQRASNYCIWDCTHILGCRIHSKLLIYQYQMLKSNNISRIDTGMFISERTLSESTTASSDIPKSKSNWIDLRISTIYEYITINISLVYTPARRVKYEGYTLSFLKEQCPWSHQLCESLLKVKSIFSNT